MKVFIHTDDGVLIEVNPKTKIPRTYKRFSFLMAQLLKKLKIRASTTKEVLLKIIKNPVVNHLPKSCITFGTSTQARMVKLRKFVTKMPKNGPVAFVIGAVSKGNPALECDYLDDSICISKYGLSASCAISKIVNEFEEHWDIE